MAKERLETYLPAEFIKWYQKSPEVYSQDGTFLGRDLASEKNEGSILRTLGILSLITGAASSRLELSGIGTALIVFETAISIIKQK